ncbi:MAG: tRNA lysidine(34) synthetase TilS [Crocinitomicaceae bacterium]
MLEQFKATIKQDFPDFNKYEIYVASSGGIDSMVLTSLLISVGYQPVILHCNFKLRAAASEADEKFVKDFAKANNCKVITTAFETEKIAANRKTNIQETARDLRYEWFRSIVKNHKSLILTAHHLDDAVESFFMNILRGTGIKGLSAIPKINPPFYRPLLQFSQEQITRYAQTNKITFREDQSNQKTIYRRNKLRHEIIPLFHDLEPEFTKKMKSFFSEMTDLNEWMDINKKSLIKKLIIQNENQTIIDIQKLKKLSTFELKLVVEDFNINRKKLTEFSAFLDSDTGAVFNSNSHQFLINRGQLIIKEQSKNFTIHETIDNLPYHLQTSFGVVDIKASDYSVITPKNNLLQLDFDKIKLPIRIRNWRHGDRITPLGMKGSKLISDILIDKKNSQFEKNKILVLESESGELIAIINFLISDDYKISSTTKRILEVK